jgi:hydroxyacylglutathione hydrolase
VVAHGDTVRLGESVARVVDVGGHTLGHIAFVFDAGSDNSEEVAAPVAFVGDALFALGCGRLFEGSAQQAWDSLCRLMALPDATMVYCAHEYTEANARFCATVETGNAALVARIEAIRAARAQGLPTVPTTIGLERATNPFVRPAAPGVRAAMGLSPDVPDVTVFAAVRAAKDHFR